MFTFIIKPVPTKFVLLRGKEVEAGEVFNTLEEFIADDDIKGYDLGNQSIADILASEGVLEKYIGSRMATLYRKTSKFTQFYNTFVSEHLGY